MENGSFDCSSGEFPIVRRIAAQDVVPGINPNAADLIAAGVGRPRTKPKRSPRVSRPFKDGCKVIKGKSTKKCKGCSQNNCPLVLPGGKLNLWAVEYYMTYRGELGRWWEERTFGSER